MSWIFLGLACKFSDFSLLVDDCPLSKYFFCTLEAVLLAQSERKLDLSIKHSNACAQVISTSTLTAVVMCTCVHTFALDSGEQYCSAALFQRAETGIASHLDYL